MKILAAPLQGYTTAAWRHWHHRLIGGCDAWYAPFIRLEGGIPRRHDMRELFSPLLADVPSVIQVICSSADELLVMIENVTSAGHNHIDINMGCPFVPQIRKHRGAGLLGCKDVMKDMAGVMKRCSESVSFTVKMRLGIDDPDQWCSIIDIVDSMPLEWLTIHARTARQQYGGSADLDRAVKLARTTRHKVIYNGDITTPDDIDRVMQTGVFEGVMIGRGLLGRPTLAAEWRSGEELTPVARIEVMKQLHTHLAEYYGATLCGDHQVLASLRPFWDYAAGFVERRQLKAVAKARTLDAYLEAVRAIR